MAEEKEKRFQKVMDKLFHAPKTKPSHSSSSSVGMQPSKGKKPLKSLPVARQNHLLRRNLVEENDFRCSLVPLGSQVSLCRPWERGDLMRRLATFKSMTWFAKPKVVSPVNCARRGWINVDNDTISCESCGARLLFSTSSSWTQQQVEKAAAVFSLKLDSGHKLLCPWIDNACDEPLALFPATPAPALVENYKERSTALLRLSALPLISPSAIDYMWDAKLQWFLEQYSYPLCTLGGRAQSIESFSDEKVDNEATVANLYYQAQKLISLCGWEPRLLPYIVDCEHQAAKSTKDASMSGSSPQNIDGPKPSINIYSSTGSDKVSDAQGNNNTISECHPEPTSVVLDCSLCGASVGLWVYLTVRQPLELIRLIESPEKYSQVDSSNYGVELGKELSLRSVAPNEKASLLNLTIAGGPPPTKQNPRATVSLPIISRHLRSGFCSNLNARKLKRKRSEDEFSPNGKSNEIEAASENERSVDKEIPSSSDCVGEKSTENRQNMLQDMDRSGKEAETTAAVTAEKNDSLSQSRKCPTDANRTPRTGENGNENSLEPSGPNVLHSSVTLEDTHHDPTSMVVSSLIGNACDMNLEKGDKGSDTVSTDAQLHNRMVKGLDTIMRTSAKNEVITALLSGDDLKLLTGERIMQFDPIKQHRHFCPWISSTDSTRLPGWQLTLSALHQESSHDLVKDPESHSKNFEVDDPITSVRQLFMSPAEKKRKYAYGKS